MLVNKQIPNLGPLLVNSIELNFRLQRVHILPELLVYIPSVELARPHHQNQRQHRYNKRQRRQNRKRLPETMHPVALQRLRINPRLRHLVVQLPGHQHVQNVRPDGAGQLPEIEQRRVMLQPEDLRNHREVERHLGAHGEPDEDGGEVERVLERERHYQMADAGHEEDQRQHQRPRELVLLEQDFRDEPGEDSAREVEDADQGDEGVDGLVWVAEGFSDLAEVIDGGQARADPDEHRHEEDEHVDAQDRLEDGEVFASLGLVENVGEAGAALGLDRGRR